MMSVKFHIHHQGEELTFNNQAAPNVSSWLEVRGEQAAVLLITWSCKMCQNCSMKLEEISVLRHIFEVCLWNLGLQGGGGEDLQSQRRTFDTKGRSDGLHSNTPILASSSYQ